MQLCVCVQLYQGAYILFIGKLENSRALLQCIGYKERPELDDSCLHRVGSIDLARVAAMAINFLASAHLVSLVEETCKETGKGEDFSLFEAFETWRTASDGPIPVEQVRIRMIRERERQKKQKEDEEQRQKERKEKEEEQRAAARLAEQNAEKKRREDEEFARKLASAQQPARELRNGAATARRQQGESFASGRNAQQSAMENPAPPNASGATYDENIQQTNVNPSPFIKPGARARHQGARKAMESLGHKASNDMSITNPAAFGPTPTAHPSSQTASTAQPLSTPPLNASDGSQSQVHGRDRFQNSAAGERGRGGIDDIGLTANVPEFNRSQSSQSDPSKSVNSDMYGKDLASGPASISNPGSLVSSGQQPVASPRQPRSASGRGQQVVPEGSQQHANASVGAGNILGAYPQGQDPKVHAMRAHPAAAAAMSPSLPLESRRQDSEGSPPTQARPQGKQAHLPPQRSDGIQAAAPAGDAIPAYHTTQWNDKSRLEHTTPYSDDLINAQPTRHSPRSPSKQPPAKPRAAVTANPDAGGQKSLSKSSVSTSSSNMLKTGSSTRNPARPGDNHATRDAMMMKSSGDSIASNFQQLIDDDDDDEDDDDDGDSVDPSPSSSISQTAAKPSAWSTSASALTAATAAGDNAAILEDNVQSEPSRKSSNPSADGSHTGRSAAVRHPHSNLPSPDYPENVSKGAAGALENILSTSDATIRNSNEAQAPALMNMPLGTGATGKLLPTAVSNRRPRSTMAANFSNARVVNPANVSTKPSSSAARLPQTVDRSSSQNGGGGAGGTGIAPESIVTEPATRASSVALGSPQAVSVNRDSAAGDAFSISEKNDGVLASRRHPVESIAKELREADAEVSKTPEALDTPRRRDQEHSADDDENNVDDDSAVLLRAEIREPSDLQSVDAHDIDKPAESPTEPGPAKGTRKCKWLKCAYELTEEDEDVEICPICDRPLSS